MRRHIVDTVSSELGFALRTGLSLALISNTNSTAYEIPEIQHWNNSEQLLEEQQPNTHPSYS